jgi:replicative superfamily II helicase
MNQNSLKPPLDKWQAQALDALNSGHNLIVDAPTSAGKTRVVEEYIENGLQKGHKFIYTAPVKSLTNDKYKEFTALFSHRKVGIHTGDFKDNLDAPIVLMTLESYRNVLLSSDPSDEDSKYFHKTWENQCIIFDEYHFIQEEERGSVWEETIILTREDHQWIFLSASVPNAEEFQGWLGELNRRPCELIRVKERPVPLTHKIFVNNVFQSPDKLNLSPKDKNEFLKTMKYQPNLPLGPIQKALKEGFGPIMVYTGRRASAEQLAFQLAQRASSDYPHKELLKSYIERMEHWDLVPASLLKMIPEKGIAYHHSGLLPIVRLMIEGLLKEGLLQACIGTTGMSLGVNFSVKSACIADVGRPSAWGYVAFTPGEVLQMLGRAGRRGKDTEGLSLWISPGHYMAQKPQKLPPCRSALKVETHTLIGLLNQLGSIKKIAQFYRNSFFIYSKTKQDKNPGQKHKNNQKNNNETIIMESIKKILKHLHRSGFIHKDGLTSLGEKALMFPQMGSLVIAYWIEKEIVTENNLYLLGVFCAAQHRSISLHPEDQSEVKKLKLLKNVNQFYPPSLFSDLYDMKDDLEFREANIGAVSLIKDWVIKGITWNKLKSKYCSKSFSEGDMMMVLLRFATFLQSARRLFGVNLDTHFKNLFRHPIDPRELLK